MSAPAPRPGRLPRSPVVLRDGRWWLVGRSGTIPVSDPEVTAVLDELAQAMAAADRTVSALRSRQGGPSDAGGRR
ncbi:hypothetical protein [Streptomyces sp. PTY087I2]|uniref:hypothetical protein n=1 Tax=Streptomyces sp. PTY087I2 TaxID=1819298 RepID=UPI00082772D8|nr:hypothetical protein [Streptomyces sp. PTY087I2]OCC11535.1 hypothetical protein A3Q37_02732 [Streptomyces sp. PTY087I2]